MEQLRQCEWVQVYHNSSIKEICFQADGCCTVFFRNGTTAHHFVGFELAYQSQFGVPISPDGSLIFISSWEHGLTAFDSKSGRIVWQYQKSRSGRVFPYSNFVLVHRYGIGLAKIEIRTGTVQHEMSSPSLEHCFFLDHKHLLLDRPRGKLNVLDVETMTVLSTYSKKIFNPNDCLSICSTGDGSLCSTGDGSLCSTGDGSLAHSTGDGSLCWRVVPLQPQLNVTHNTGEKHNTQNIHAASCTHAG